MRFVQASGRGLPRMSRAQHHDWVRAVVGLRPAVFGVTEQWFGWYLRSLRANARGYSVYAPQTLPWGNQGTGVCWKTADFDVVAKRCVFLHSIVRDGVRIISGTRRMATIVLREKATGVVFAVGVVHTTPHLSKPSAFTAWTRAMRRVDAWVHEQVQLDRRVVLLGDFNAGPQRMHGTWAGERLGNPIRVRTSSSGLHIDHAVLIGDWTVVGTGNLGGTPSDHAPLWVDANPTGKG